MNVYFQKKVQKASPFFNIKMIQIIFLHIWLIKLVNKQEIILCGGNKFLEKILRKKFLIFVSLEENTLCLPKLTVWVVGYSRDTSKEQKLKNFFLKIFSKNLFPLPANLNVTVVNWKRWRQNFLEFLFNSIQLVP